MCVFVFLSNVNVHNFYVGVRLISLWVCVCGLSGCMDFFLCVWFHGFYCVGVSLSLVGCEWVGYTIYIYILF